MASRASLSAARSRSICQACSAGFDALEPTIDAQTMELHHGRHHQAYVTNLNGVAAQNGEVNIAGELIYDFGLPIDAHRGGWKQGHRNGLRANTGLHD